MFALGNKHDQIVQHHFSSLFLFKINDSVTLFFFLCDAGSYHTGQNNLITDSQEVKLCNVIDKINSAGIYVFSVCVCVCVLSVECLRIKAYRLFQDSGVGLLHISLCVRSVHAM